MKNATLPRLALLLLVALQPACGGGGPSEHILRAPVGVDRWEPSGVVVHDGRLWVVNDRDGWIAGYDLPLARGANLPALAHQVRPPGLKKVKWEGAAPAERGGILMLEAFSRSVWRCPDPGRGCRKLVEVDIAPVRSAVDALAAREVEWIAYEGLAAGGERLLVGTRGLVEKGGRSADFVPWTVVLDPAARHVFDGASWPRGERRHGLSAMAFDGDRLWTAWSYEDEADETRGGVSGVIGRADVDAATGLPGRPRMCLEVDGKPEGLAVWEDKLVVVFDQDKVRKDPNDPAKFPFTADRDLARIFPKSFCDAPGEPLP